MAKLRLTKEFRFEMAHALWNYDGPCRNIHGHSYSLNVTVIGEPISDINNPKYGMVMDFGEIKAIVKADIVNVFDHSVVFSNKAPVEQTKAIDQMFNKIEIVDYQPTCENLLIDFAGRIKSKLPKGVKLYSLKLRETPSGYAEWYAEDN